MVAVSAHANRAGPVADGEGSPTRSPHLPCARLELAFRAGDVLWLPPFRAALWRSVLGPALKRVDARSPQPVFTGAPANLYDWVLETRREHCLAPPRAHESPPHPLTIDTPLAEDWQFVAPGHTLRVQLSLFGRLAALARIIAGAFDDAARRGLGKAITGEGRRGRAQLISVHQVWLSGGRARALFSADDNWLRPAEAVWLPPPRPAGPVRVSLASPLRLKRDGCLVRPETFIPGDLVMALVGRVAALMASETGARLDVDFAALKTQCERLCPLATDLDWREVGRWSSRQEREVPCGGIVGEFVVDLAEAPDLFAYLWAGQWTGAGKGAAMGLGSIRVMPA